MTNPPHQRIHILQHVPYEGPGALESCFTAARAQISFTRFYQDEPLPDPEAIDALVVLGGPMSDHDVEAYPWLNSELAFLREILTTDVPVLGVCLGAQLIARAMGAKVTPAAHREIGWFPIRRSPACSDTFFRAVFPEELEVFHWHGDTFALPEGAIHLASSESCENQGFLLDNRIVGLQFHLETTKSAAQALIHNCPGDLKPGPYVQTPAEMLENPARFTQIHQVLNALMERFLNT